MNNVSHFSGRLMLHRLPRLTPGERASMPALKRLALSQGELAQIHDSDTAVRYIAALELRMNSIRGNHYHLNKLEHLYVVSGRVNLVAQEIDAGEQVELVVDAGDLAVIQPRVAHAFRVIDSGSAIEFAQVRFDPSDILSYNLL